MLITDLSISRNYFPRFCSKRRKIERQREGAARRRKDGRKGTEGGGNLRVEAFLARDNGEHT